MNKQMFNYLQRKFRGMDESQEHRHDRRGRGSHEGRRGRDYDDYEDSREYRGRYYGEYEGRDHVDYEDEYDETPIRLSKSDAKRWKKMMENFDGTHGEHYTYEQTHEAAEKLGIKFDDYNEMEFCLTLNMMYSDYGHVLKMYIPPDRELHVCAELAKAFLEDPDGPEASEKLALYFHCIVCPDL